MWSETKLPLIIIDPSTFDKFETESFENNDVFQCKSTVKLMIHHNGQLRKSSELSFGLRIKKFNQEEAHVVFTENFPTILFKTKDHERFVLTERLNVIFSNLLHLRLSKIRRQNQFWGIGKFNIW